MISNHNGRLALGLVLALSAASHSPAHALTLVQTDVICNNCFVNAPFSRAVTFDLFDPTMGTLSAVTLSLTTSGVVPVYGFNPTFNYSVARASATVKATISGLGSSSVSTVSSFGPYAGGLFPGWNAQLNSNTSSFGPATVSLGEALFNMYTYVGSGSRKATVNYSLGVEVVDNGSDPGVTVYGNGGFTPPQFSIIYEYVPTVQVPIPGVPVLFCSGALAVAVLGRRRRAARLHSPSLTS